MFKVCVNRIDNLPIYNFHQAEVNRLLCTICLVFVEEARLSFHKWEPTVFAEHNCERAFVLGYLIS